MITLNGVSKKLGKFNIKDISIEIPDGYICGLAGQNGAGKTSLMHMILGLYKPDAGEVLVDGKSYSENEEEIRKLFGIVLAEELFEPGYSLVHNGVTYGSFYSGFDKAKYTRLLKEFELIPQEKYMRLSKGQKLKCQFAFALACNPKYLVLDEPAASFDPNFRKQFYDKLKEFIGNGDKSVILATHMTEELDVIGDYLIYMEDGNVVYSGDIEAFRDKYRIVSGEKYKIKLMKAGDIINIEDGAYGCKALIRHRTSCIYDKELQVTCPSISEFMYHYSKRNERNGD